jgi:hypothetical protein
MLMMAFKTPLLGSSRRRQAQTAPTAERFRVLKDAAVVAPTKPFDRFDIDAIVIGKRGQKADDKRNHTEEHETDQPRADHGIKREHPGSAPRTGAPSKAFLRLCRVS